MTASEEASRTGVVAESTDLLRMLHQDHLALLDMFVGMEQRDVREELDQLRNLFAQVVRGLRTHMEGEERFLYAVLEQHVEARQQVLESFEEHHLAKLLLTALQSLALDDERWGPKLRVLHRVTERHMVREEQDVFPLAAALLGEEQMGSILQQILRLKAENAAGA